MVIRRGGAKGSGAGVGSFEVVAGGVGLGLVASAGGRLFVLLDGAVALVEEVEHLAGVELGSAAEPVTALGLRGGVEVVLGGVAEQVLAALGVGEAEVGHLQARVDEVAGLAGVFEDALVGGDGGGAVAFVLGEVCFF